MEYQMRLDHGNHRRPHQRRNPPGSGASWAHSLTNATTERHGRGLLAAASLGRERLSNLDPRTGPKTTAPPCARVVLIAKSRL
eukprot:3242951-Pyramimonas_sp.AAC.1